MKAIFRWTRYQREALEVKREKGEITAQECNTQMEILLRMSREAEQGRQDAMDIPQDYEANYISVLEKRVAYLEQMVNRLYLNWPYSAAMGKFEPPQSRPFWLDLE